MGSEEDRRICRMYLRGSDHKASVARFMARNGLPLSLPERIRRAGRVHRQTRRDVLPRHLLTAQGLNAEGYAEKAALLIIYPLGHRGISAEYLSLDPFA